jgi:hypothetical protein
MSKICEATRDVVAFMTDMSSTEMLNKDDSRQNEIIIEVGRQRMPVIFRMILIFV